MTTRTTSGCIVPGLLMLACAATATAQDRGFYAGVDMGVANFSDDVRILFGNTQLDPVDVDDNTFVLGVSGGFRFSRYFAIEAGWRDLGEARAQLADVAGGSSLAGEVRYSVQGVTTSFVAILPIGRRWELFARAGLMFSDVDLAVDVGTSPAPFLLRRSSDSAHAYFGLGANHHFNERWQMKLELGFHNDVGDEDTTGITDIFAMTLGVAYKF